MLNIMMMESTIQIIFTFFLCLLSKSIFPHANIKGSDFHP